MRKSMFANLAAAALLSTLAAGAEALTVPRLAGQDDGSIVTPVRDGCGPFRYFSRRWGRCVRF